MITICESCGRDTGKPRQSILSKSGIGLSVCVSCVNSLSRIGWSLLNPVKPMDAEKSTPLTITKEKVLEAASKCSTAAAALKTLFPECFSQPFNLMSLNVAYAAVVTEKASVKAGLGPLPFMQITDGSGRCDYGTPCFYLIGRENKLHWELVPFKDDYLLIPTRKDS